MFARLRSLWRNTAHRAEVDRALDLELAAYVDLLAAEKMRAGMTPEGARRAARAEAGITAATEAVRDVRSGAFLEGIVRDIRHAARALRRTPAFAIAAVLTLGIGLGATTTIFSVVNAALLRPLPFAGADRLALVTEFSPAKTTRTGAPYPDVLEWQRENSSFSEMASYWNVPGDGVVFGAPGNPERLHYSIVSDHLFDLLGFRPAIGRGFLASEAVPGHGNVFIASDALWRRSLGARTDALGHTYLIDGTPYTLVGVMPRSVQFPDDCDVWVPLGALDGYPLDRISHQFWVIGRLKPRVSIAQAQAEMSTIEHRLGVTYPVTDAGWQVRVQPLLDEYVGDVRASLLVLLGAAGFILLIACASIANLTLARALTRGREFAIRTALGASRGRLVRHCLVESALVTGAGLALAFVIVALTHQSLFAFTGLGTSRVVNASIDLRVGLFAAALGACVCMLVGLTPALHAIRRAPQESLRGTPGTDGNRGTGRRMRGALVVVELTLTVLLLAGAGLMARSFIELRRIDPGFNPDHLLTMQVALPDALYPTQRSRNAFYGDLLARTAALPGVQGAAGSDELPLKLGTDFGESFNIVGRPTLDWAHSPAALNHPVSTTYFSTMQIPVLRGRAFQPGDTDVMVINRAMADAYWPGVDPLDQQVATLDAPSRPLRIIGIVGNVRSIGLDQGGAPEMYYLGGAWTHISLVVRTIGDPMTLAGSMRRVVAALDPHAALYHVAPMSELVSASLGTRRFGLVLLAAFAGFALTIAAVGVGGLLAFTVSQRTHEIGIRTALGARSADIVRSVGGPIVVLVAIGVVLGLTAATMLTRLMTSMLFGVAPGDIASLAGAALLVAVVALGACYLPVRRALQVDPLLALRRD